MSIPLYLLTGFLKRDAVAPEAALKFFLVGTVSSAVIVYGMSFIYGVTGSTALDAIPPALARRRSAAAARAWRCCSPGLGFKIAAFPFHMWAPDTYEAASTPFVAWLSVAPKAAGFVAIIRLYVEGVGTAAADLDAGSSPTLAGMTIVTGNLMAIPQQNIKRLLAYSGIAHIGYMLIGLAALSSAGVAMMLFYLVAYLFGNMGAFLVVEAVARSEQSDEHRRVSRAWRSDRRCSRWRCWSSCCRSAASRSWPASGRSCTSSWPPSSAGMYGLVFLGAVLTVVALYYYLLVARRMYIEAPDAARAGADARRCSASPSPSASLGVVGMGVYPGPWVDDGRARRLDAVPLTGGPV